MADCTDKCTIFHSPIWVHYEIGEGVPVSIRCSSNRSAQEEVDRLKSYGYSPHVKIGA